MLLPREVLIIRARLLSASRAPLNPSGLVEFYFAFFLFVLGGFLLPIRPLHVCAASPSFLPFLGHVVEFWGRNSKLMQVGSRSKFIFGLML